MSKKNSAPLSASVLCLILALVPVVVIANPQQGDLKSAQKAVRMENYGLAFKRYFRAAKNGDTEAQFQLANLYRLGKGVEASDALERYWLEQSAAANHAGAQYSLALQIQSEESERATALMQSAATAGFAPAQTYLKQIGEGSVVGGGDQLSVEERWFVAARKNRLDVLRALKPKMAGVDVLDPQQRTALAVAVQAGSADTVAWLLRQGADPAHRDRFGKSAGFIAIDSQRSKLLKKLFSAGLDPKTTLPNGDTLLHYTVRRSWAVSGDQTDMLKLLLDKSVAINQHNSDGWTALDLAQFSDSDTAVALLTRHDGERGNGWFNSEQAPQNAMAAQWTGDEALDVVQLSKIVSAGNDKLLRQLVDNRPELISQTLPDGSTLLGIAIANGQASIVGTLLDRGAKLDTPVDGRLIALHSAAQLGQVAIALKLFQRGANPVSVDNSGHDAIELALLSGYPELALALMGQIQADKTTRQPLPIDRYVYTAARADSIEFVRHIGSQMQHSYRDKHDRSALWYAASHASEAMVAELMDFGVSVDTPDVDGKTPLLVAAERGCLPCIKRLSKAANINRQNHSGNSALMAAAGRADLALVEWLIAKEADVQLRNTLGDTALIVAVRSGAVAVVKALVGAGARVSRNNKMGLSARDIAEKNGPEMMAALSGH